MGFIALALQHYQGKQDQVVNALFENTLPTHLAAMSRSLTLEEALLSHTEKPAKSQPTPGESTKVGTTHRSVFDGDEFDILTRGGTVDTSRIIFGKKCVVILFGLPVANQSIISRQNQ
jgi:hypothetical protein